MAACRRRLFQCGALFGCPDADNDGTAQSNDAFPDDPTQWADTDNDGYGGSPTAQIPMLVLQLLTSTIDRFGCPDED